MYIKSSLGLSVDINMVMSVHVLFRKIKNPTFSAYYCFKCWENKDVESSFIKALKNDFCIISLSQSWMSGSLWSALPITLLTMSGCMYFLIKINR